MCCCGSWSATCGLNPLHRIVIAVHKRRVAKSVCCLHVHAGKHELEIFLLESPGVGAAKRRAGFIYSLLWNLESPDSIRRCAIELSSSD